MTDRYRDIYNSIETRSSVFGGAGINNFDDMMRERGIDVYGTDEIIKSNAALMILMAERIKALEEEVERLTNNSLL